MNFPLQHNEICTVNKCNYLKDGTSKILAVRYYNHFKKTSFNDLIFRLLP